MIARYGSGGPGEETYGHSRVVVARLIHPDHLVEVEVEAYLGGRL